VEQKISQRHAEQKQRHTEKESANIQQDALTSLYFARYDAKERRFFKSTNKQINKNKKDRKIPPFMFNKLNEKSN
jgi:hypothetical protein